MGEMTEATRAYIEEIEAEVLRLKAFAERLSRLARQGELPPKGVASARLTLSRLPEPGNAVEEALFKALMDCMTHGAARQ